MTDNNLSYLISSGLVRSRDGSSLSPSGQPYISLPSPNIQSVKPPPQSNHSQMMEDYNGRELPGPDTSQLARRGALVPPKMDEEEDYDEEVVCCLTTIFLIYRSCMHILSRQQADNRKYSLRHSKSRAPRKQVRRWLPLAT